MEIISGNDPITSVNNRSAILLTCLHKCNSGIVKYLRFGGTLTQVFLEAEDARQRI